MDVWHSFLQPPRRDYGLILLLLCAFVLAFLLPEAGVVLAVCAFVAVIPTFIHAFRSIITFRISIDVFNAFAIAVSFVTGEHWSAGFIALMLCFARLLDWITESRTHHAMEELLKLKPLTAIRERDGRLEEVAVDAVVVGDVIVIKEGSRVPVDGVVIFGVSHLNEASVTGESAPVLKVVGDSVLSATVVQSGVIKIRATHVGRDSTIERMAALMREAAKNKSRTEKMADRFAGLFLPIIALLGVGTWMVSHNTSMVAALFLIACADDMAVAIPLAMTAALGMSAKRGVIIKGGEWLDTLGKVDTIILDKTGTLTYGSLSIREARRASWISEHAFWEMLAIAEKFSEHPVGRMVFREAVHRIHHVPDPEQFEVIKGAGVRAVYGANECILGTRQVVEQFQLPMEGLDQLDRSSTFVVFVNRRFAGSLTIEDAPRAEAASSLKQLRKIGIQRILMLTGDNEETAKEVAQRLGMTEFHAAMKPQDKLQFVEALLAQGQRVAMLGDGVNDAPTLARADVGIAMGGEGTAVAAEAADIVILTDDLSRLPETILLARRTSAIVRLDVVIWAVSNVVGFTLVFTGIAGPAFAAFYNFATDFLPLLNSSRLFKHRATSVRRSK